MLMFHDDDEVLQRTSDEDSGQSYHSIETPGGARSSQATSTFMMTTSSPKWTSEQLSQYMKSYTALTIDEFFQSSAASADPGITIAATATLATHSGGGQDHLLFM